MIKKKLHVAVLMGGWNSEREVSLRSGEAVYGALLQLGYQATKIDFARDICDRLKEAKPDVVFNALHGRYFEDGRLQGLLDILDIPYTHSGIAASVVGMNKVLTQKICADIGLRCPQQELLVKGEFEKNQKKIAAIGKPFVIKPVDEGSSVGVEVILEETQFDLANYEWKHGNKIIVERYIAGQELNVAIMDGKALGVLEVRPKKLFFDYECKYTAGMTDYVMPAEISEEKYAQALVFAEKLHREIGCSGISRVELILNNKNNGDNELYLLEINTHPGFTATSIVPKIAKHVGISFEDIVDYLVKSARCGL